MAVKLTLRKEDLALIKAVSVLLGNYALSGTKVQKSWDSFSARALAAAAKPKANRGEGVSVRRAIDIFRGVLGRRLIEPAGKPAPFWFVQLQNKLNASGITEELARQAAEMASVAWPRGYIKAQSIINQADVLLSQATTSQLGTALKAEAEDMSDL